MADYSPTTWNNRAEPAISPETLNHMEGGIAGSLQKSGGQMTGELLLKANHNPTHSLEATNKYYVDNITKVFEFTFTRATPNNGETFVNIGTIEASETPSEVGVGGCASYHYVFLVHTQSGDPYEDWHWEIVPENTIHSIDQHHGNSAETQVKITCDRNLSSGTVKWEIEGRQKPTYSYGWYPIKIIAIPAALTTGTY